MLVRVPAYWGAFRCLAGACPHTCCEKWEVVVDNDTAQRYRSEPGALGDKLRTALRQDADGDWCFPLNGGRCPFLDGDNLCEIHRALGAEATSETCQEHPRFWEDYGAFRFQNGRMRNRPRREMLGWTDCCCCGKRRLPCCKTVRPL